MKLFNYIVMASFFMVAGCSGDEASPEKTQTTAQEDKETETTKSEGALGHFSGQVGLATEAKRQQEEADKKRKEMEQGI